MLPHIIKKLIRINLSGIIFFFVFTAIAECTEPELEQVTFPATGYNETLLHIKTPGRYSIQTKSQQGTRVELVDQMAGPVASAGQVGELDGRLDIFLDTGQYKVRLYSHLKGQGELVLNALAFRETQMVVQAEDRPLLKELQLESTTLADLQQRSYWLYLKNRQILRLEAMGRNLKDCRIWRNGDWLVAVNPAVSTYEPVSGQPMTYLEFHHDLNPGLYRFTCYGGEALQWAEESPESPLYLRMGLPKLGPNGQNIITVSPFGRDVFLVSGKADFFELTRKDKKDTLLQVSPWNEQNSRHQAGRQALINKESRDPWCSLNAGNGDNLQFAAIQASPGDKVVLTYFTRRADYRFPRRGKRDYWLSLQSSAAAGDTIDATAMLIRKSRTSRRAWIEDSKVIEVGSAKTYYRKVNVLGTTTVLLKVLEEGTYVIEETPDSGAKCEYQLEPFLLPPPEDYVAPPFTDPEKPLELTKGFYGLTLRPRSKGILSFILRKKGAAPAFEPLDAKEKVEAQRILWPRLSISSNDDDYLLLLNSRHEVVSGLIVRQLPLDLNDPLPVTLLPAEQAPVNIQVKEESKLFVENDRDATFEIFGYHAPISSGSLLAPGKYTLNLKNTSQQTTLFTLKTVPAKEIVTLSKNELAQKAQEIEEFPLLTDQEPVFRDFDRTEQQHFSLLVKEPGLYRLETSGRLATGMTVRTRLITSLFSKEQNGIGRNALVQQYLRPGEYQVTVQALGRSKGRSGIHLRQTALTEEEGLKVGVRKKITLLPDAAVRYRLEIEDVGEYWLHTLGLNKTFAWRFEDQEGWPLVKPNQQGPFQQEFEAGEYYYYSLPEAVESRRVTVLEPIKTATESEGKGPHTLTFNAEIAHIWREEEGRPPDVYVLDVHDPVNTTVYLAEDMEATMYKCEPTPTPSQEGNNDVTLSEVEGLVCEEEIAWIRGDLPKEFENLLPGRYEFHVKSIEESDRVPYSLLLEMDQLITGVSQTISDLPAALTVNVGNDSLVDIFSFGATDVKATLWDGNHRIAHHDDMEDDWNFLISRKIQAGTYLLKLEQVGSDGVAEFDVNMAKRAEIALASQEFPFTTSVEVDREVVSIPFTTSTQEQLIQVSASGNGAAKLALFKGNQLLAESEDDLLIPLSDRTNYTLLCWRIDQAKGQLRLHAKPLSLQEVNLSAEPTMIEPPADALAGFRLTHAGKISYRLQGNVAPLYFSPRIEQPFQKVEELPVVMHNRSGWLLWQTVPQTSPFAKNTLTITPFALSDSGLDIVALERFALPFDFEHVLDAPLLLEIQSVGAKIGAMVASGEHELASIFYWFGMFIEPSRTLIAVPKKGSYRGKIWSTSNEPVRGKVRVRQRTFPLEKQIPWGAASGYEETLQPGGSHKIRLDVRPHSLNLLLTKGLVAFVWQDGQAEVITAATAGNLQQTLRVEGGELILLNTGKEIGMYRIEKSAGSAEIAQTLNEGAGFEKVFSKPGKILLNVPKTGKATFVAGDQVKSRFLRDDGHLLEETETLISQIGSVKKYPAATGLLEIWCESGYVKVWQSDSKNPQQHFAGTFSEFEAEALQDTIVSLENAPQMRRITVAAPTYIITKANTPGITALIRQGNVLATTAGSHSTGRQLEYLLQPGDYLLYTRPLKDLRQEGSLSIRKITPYALDKQTEVKNWLIQANETQVFHFNVTTDAKVGVGVQTESDQLETRLRDRQFNLIASGPLVIQELNAGEYLFTVKSSGPAASAVRYQPVLYGNQGSRQGIPPEVMEAYKNQN